LLARFWDWLKSLLRSYSSRIEWHCHECNALHGKGKGRVEYVILQLCGEDVAGMGAPRVMLAEVATDRRAFCRSGQSKGAGPSEDRQRPTKDRFR
jgi:hypothetical protein